MSLMKPEFAKTGNALCYVLVSNRKCFQLLLSGAFCRRRAVHDRAENDANQSNHKLFAQPT